MHQKGHSSFFAWDVERERERDLQTSDCAKARRAERQAVLVAVSLSSVEGNVLDNSSFRISQWPLFLLMRAEPAILKTRMVLKLKMELGLLGTRAEVVWGENIQTV